VERKIADLGRSDVVDRDFEYVTRFTAGHLNGIDDDDPPRPGRGEQDVEKNVPYGGADIQNGDVLRWATPGFEVLDNRRSESIVPEKRVSATENQALLGVEGMFHYVPLLWGLCKKITVSRMTEESNYCAICAIWAIASGQSLRKELERPQNGDFMGRKNPKSRLGKLIIL
jgi:hypothetical protein